MLEEVRSTLLKKMGKIYIMLCLCGKSERYDSLMEEINIKE
jgi:hypothetical protein